MDKRDGTGRGRRGDRKEGQGKGGWGGKKPDMKAEEEEKGAPEEETKEAAQPEPEEEEEEVGFTLDDYFAQKQAKAKGLIEMKEARKHEKIAEKTQSRGGDKERVQAGQTGLTGRETYSVRPDANAALLGFQTRDDDDFESRGRGGGRGGRGGRDQGPREQRQGGGRRRGGKLAVNDDDFPTL